jgi:hypothetical protein
VLRHQADVQAVVGCVDVSASIFGKLLGCCLSASDNIVIISLIIPYSHESAVSSVLNSSKLMSYVARGTKSHPGSSSSTREQYAFLANAGGAQITGRTMD